MTTERQLTDQLQKIIDQVYAETNDMRRAAALLGNIPHTRVTRPGRFNIPTLWQISMAIHAEAAETARLLLKLVLERRTRLDLPEDWMDNIENLIRLDLQRAKRSNPELPLFRHAGLQLQFADFAEDALIDSAVLEEPWEAVHLAAAASLVFTFINARFFSSYAIAVRRNMPVPIHPFGWLELGPFVTKERADNDVPGAKSEMEEGIDRFMYSMGRDPRLVFSDNREFAHLREDGPDLNKPAQTFASELIGLAARDDAAVYPYMIDLLEFETKPLDVPERDVVAACAATAAFRCELAAINAAQSILQTLADETSFPRRPPLVRIASRIFEQCHATYLLSADRMGQALRALPEDNPQQHQPDRERILHGYQLSGNALSTATGLWFFLHHKPGPRLKTVMSIAFLSREGSVLFPATFDERGVGESYHRFSLRDESKLPTSPPDRWEETVHTI
jgi:hypothetical protein